MPDYASLRHEFRVSTGRRQILKSAFTSFYMYFYVIPFFSPVEIRYTCLTEARRLAPPLVTVLKPAIIFRSRTFQRVQWNASEHEWMMNDPWFKLLWITCIRAVSRYVTAFVWETRPASTKYHCIDLYVSYGKHLVATYCCAICNLRKCLENDCTNDFI